MIGPVHTTNSIERKLGVNLDPKMPIKDTSVACVFVLENLTTLSPTLDPDTVYCSWYKNSRRKCVWRSEEDCKSVVCVE